MLSAVQSYFGYPEEITKSLGVARVSSKNDESLGTQESILKGYKGDDVGILKVTKSAWSYNFLKIYVLPEIVKNGYKEIVFMRMDRVCRNLSHFVDFVNSLPHEIKLTIIEESELSCNLKRYSPINQNLQIEINKYQLESDIKSSRSRRDWENRRALQAIGDSLGNMDMIQENDPLLDGVYEIEDFGERKTIDGSIHYNVKWKGYTDRTFEKRSDLMETSSQHLLDHENEKGYGKFKRARNN